MKDQLILESDEGPCRFLTLNRPESRNAFNFALAEALPPAISRAARDKKVKIVVLRGAGEAFSAGGDIKLFRENLPTSAKAFRRISGALNKAIATISTMPQIVVGAVRGPAYAAGFGLAIACDLTVASEDSRLSPSFINIALSPNASTTFYLPRLIGPKRALEACLRGRVYSAIEARDIGLINEAWSEKSFESELQRLIQDLSSRPSSSLARVKKVIRATYGRDLKQQLELEKKEIAASSESWDFKEGVKAFVEKRKPSFRGRGRG